MFLFLFQIRIFCIFLEKNQIICNKIETSFNIRVLSIHSAPHHKNKALGNILCYYSNKSPSYHLIIKKHFCVCVFVVDFFKTIALFIAKQTAEINTSHSRILSILSSDSILPYLRPIPSIDSILSIFFGKIRNLIQLFHNSKFFPQF